MNEMFVATAWPMIAETLKQIEADVRAAVPHVRMTAGHNRNPVFPFRVYADYAAGGRVVTISVDVRQTDGGVVVTGDIAKEDGYVLEDLFDVSVGESDLDEAAVRDLARRFSDSRAACAAVVARELGCTG